MQFTMTKEEFLLKSGIPFEDLERSGLDWHQLEQIAKHHETASKTLALHGGAIANRLQEFDGVHSVRWRVKDTLGLLKKIVRKNLEIPTKEKWKTITPQNYRSVVSDLIGVRALHLLKEDCLIVDEQIRSTWEITDVSIFKRDGDRQLTEIIERGAREDIHDAGYRSIHYDIAYSPEKAPILVEVQVRTIFQEGWSEIDHKVKYPDFSESDLLIHYLDLFNGLSGTADDMGSFVIKLDKLIKSTDIAILKGEADLASRDSDIEALQIEINKLKAEGSASKTSIDSLQSSVDNIKEKSSTRGPNSHLADALGLNLSELYNLKHSSLAAQRLNSLSNMFHSETELAKIYKKLSSQDNGLSKALIQLTTPDSTLSKAIEQMTSPESTLAKAFDQLNSPASRLSRALALHETPSSAIKNTAQSLLQKKPDN